MSALSLTLALALLLDLALGDPHCAGHPVALFGRAAACVEQGCRRAFGSSVAAGAVGWLVLVLPVGAGAALGVWGLGRIHPWAEIAGAALVLYVAIALRSLIEHAERIRRLLCRNELPAARRALSWIVSRDTADLSLEEVARGALESLSENLTDAVTSALFWAVAGYLAGGLPGLAAGAAALRALNTLDACWGYRNERYFTFGRVAARIDDLAHWLPARLTALAVALAAPLTAGSPSGALISAWRHRHDHPSPNSCWSMAAFAGALGVRLGGPTVYDGVRESYPYWNPGGRVPGPVELSRGVRLAVLATLMFILLLGGGAWLIESI